MEITVWLEPFKKIIGILHNTCMLNNHKCTLQFYRGVVKVILKLENSDVVMDLMKVCLHKKRTIFGFTYDTPLRMLIKDMPGNAYISLAKLGSYLVFLTDMAKHFLDLCAEMNPNGKLTMSMPRFLCNKYGTEYEC